jgi:hypothetical protein
MGKEIEILEFSNGTGQSAASTYIGSHVQFHGLGFMIPAQNSRSITKKQC